jgi:NADH dehydrogenase
MILVVGATGMVGGDICRRLALRGEAVRALVRRTAPQPKVEALRDLGIETVVGDVRDRASLDAACKGVDAVISTVSSMPFAFVPGENDIETTDRRGQKALIDAAHEAGVRHFVYMSFSKNLDLDFPLRNAKRSVETHLRESGMPYTILRPSCFMEVWLSPAVGFDPLNAKATIYGTGTHPLSYVAIGDVAEFAIRSLELPEARNATVEIGGPTALTPLEVVRIFEDVGGRFIERHHIEMDALAEQQAAAPDDMGRSFAGLMRCVARGDAIPMAETSTTFSIELTPVRAYAEKTLGKVPVAAG